MELIRFIFQDFEHWLGAAILLAIALEGLVRLAMALRGAPKYYYKNEKEEE
jgi:hypothetical protein